MNNNVLVTFEIPNTDYKITAMFEFNEDTMKYDIQPSTALEHCENMEEVETLLYTANKALSSFNLTNNEDPVYLEDLVEPEILVD